MEQTPMQPATARLYARYYEAAERARKCFDMYHDAREAAAWAPMRRYREPADRFNFTEPLREDWHEAIKAKDDAYREWRRAMTAEITTCQLTMPVAPRHRFTMPRSRVS